MSAPDVIVIGGGVVGMTVARRLAADGLRVTLFDRDTCGREASWAGAGVLSPGNPHRDDVVFNLQERSLAAYPEFCRALQEETGIDPEYERCGELTLHFVENNLNIARSDARAAAGQSMPDGRPVYQIHDPERTRTVEPLVTADVLGSLECRQTAQVRNPRLLRALRTSCETAGVEVRENAAVTGLATDGDRVSGVIAGGSTLSAGQIVLCAGAWSSGIGDRLGRLMPVMPVRGQMVLMKLDVRPFRPVISCGKTYLVPRRDGHVLLGATEERDAGFSKRNTAAGVSSLMETAIRMVPSLSETPVVGMWAGLRPGTPDDKPYLGRVPGMDGLIAATGHFRTGLTLAPATAEVVSALIHGRPYDIDLSCCRPGRA